MLKQNKTDDCICLCQNGYVYCAFSGNMLYEHEFCEHRDGLGKEAMNHINSRLIIDDRPEDIIDDDLL